jgi:hypothetical protein
VSESGSTTAAHHYTTTSLDCSSQHGLLARQDHQEPQPQLLHLHLPVSYCITHILTYSPTHSSSSITQSFTHSLSFFFISLNHSITSLHQSLNLSHTHCLSFSSHSITQLLNHSSSSITQSFTHSLSFFSISLTPSLTHPLSFIHLLPRPLGAPSCSACMCASCTDPTRTSPMTPALGPART